MELIGDIQSGGHSQRPIVKAESEQAESQPGVERHHPGLPTLLFLHELSYEKHQPPRWNSKHKAEWIENPQRSLECPLRSFDRYRQKMPKGHDADQASVEEIHCFENLESQRQTLSVLSTDENYHSNDGQKHGDSEPLVFVQDENYDSFNHWITF